MANKQIKNKKEEVVEETVAEVTETKEVSNFTEAQVYNEFGKYVRTYSLKDHGENFQKLAESRVTETNGWKVALL